MTKPHLENFFLSEPFLNSMTESEVEATFEAMCECDIARVRSPWSLGSIIAWLESKPADEAFSYWDFDNCLFAQYAKHVFQGRKPERFVYGFWDWYGIAAEHVDEVTRANISVTAKNFGDALANAKCFEANGSCYRRENYRGK